jgi:hypothetical protein
MMDPRPLPQTNHPGKPRHKLDLAEREGMPSMQGSIHIGVRHCTKEFRRCRLVRVGSILLEQLGLVPLVLKSYLILRASVRLVCASVFAGRYKWLLSCRQLRIRVCPSDSLAGRRRAYRDKGVAFLGLSSIFFLAINQCGGGAATKLHFPASECWHSATGREPPYWRLGGKTRAIWRGQY